MKFLTGGGENKDKKKYFETENEAHTQCIATSEHFQIVKNFQNDSFAICHIYYHYIIQNNYTLGEDDLISSSFALPALVKTSSFS